MMPARYALTVYEPRRALYLDASGAYQPDLARAVLLGHREACRLARDEAAATGRRVRVGAVAGYHRAFARGAA